MLVTTDWLKEHLSDSNLVILDTRTKPMSLNDHLPNSKLIPFTEDTGYDGKLFRDKDFLKVLFSQHQISKDKEIVCYCIHGHRASNLFL